MEPASRPPCIPHARSAIPKRPLTPTAAPILALILTLIATIAPAQAQADDLDAHDSANPGRAGSMFFGMNLGLGLARVEQSGLSDDPALGMEYDAIFGLAITRRWAAGLELSTWQPPNLDGNPSHFHMFAWHVEYTLGPHDGLVLSTSLGLGLGDGSKSKRIGSAAVLNLGYRWPLADGITLAVEAGAHGAAFTDGNALIPFTALHLRFYGQSKVRFE